MLHDQLVERGVRDACEITLVLPFGRPVPPSPETSAALLEAFAERGITFLPSRKVSALDLERRVVVLDDDTELPYDLFLGVPRHRAPDVVVESGLTEDGYVPVDPATLATRFPGVYALGDVRDPGHAEGRRVRRRRRARARDLADRADPGRRAGQASTPAPAPATSSSAATASGGSTSTSSPARPRRAPTRRRRSRCAPTSRSSARAAARAGSAARPDRPRPACERPA